MSVTRKASSAAKKPTKSPREDLAAALAERDAELAEARRQNARLIDEARARTQELAESREQQAATSEILRVISQSPTDPQPVFESIVAAAARLLGCDMAAVLLRDGEAYVHTAGATPEGPMPDLAPLRVPIDASANFPSRAFLAKTMVHLPDWSLIELPEHERQVRDMFGVNSALFLPLLRGDAAIAVLVFIGKRPNAFGPGEIAQAESFRDQALIAIENARLFRETQEALEQQKASAEVLGAISKSIADASPVFETILDACQRLFGSEELGIYTVGDDDMVRAAAWRGPSAKEVRQDVTPLAESVTGRVIRERRPHHIPDLGAVPNLSPTLRDRVARHGGASLLYAPMLQDERGLGSIIVVRWPPRPFSDREQALLQTFADQAAIAIENAHLFAEVRAKSRDLEEALEQQTATADVLKAISRSAFDLDTVLESLIATALRLCNAKQGVIFRRYGDIYRYAASHMLLDPRYRAHEQMAEIKAGRGTLIGRVALENRTVQIEDAWNDPDYAEKDEIRLTQVRAMLGVPLLRNGEPIGAFGLGRAEPVPFTQRQIELVTTFADQAVIAIENVRLFDEVQARTKDLQDALQQQTATANVLKVISRSAFDLDAVLKTLTDSARSLSGAATAAVFLRDGEIFRLRAGSGVAPEFLEFMNANPARPGKATLIGRVAMNGEPVHIPDVDADRDYSYGIGPKIGDYRAMFGAPLIRDGKVEGVFGLMHPRPSAFMPRQMEMVRVFADQAVIAIENVRLFDEVQARTREVEEALAQQTATADVLKVISRSTFDLQPVLDTLVETAARLCDTEMAFILRRDGDVFRAGAAVGHSSEYMEYLLSNPLKIDRGSVTGRVVLERRVIQILDVRVDPEYTLAQTTSLTGQRTALGVPLIRNGEVIGVIVLGRRRVEAFTARQIELVESFADQAVIAISNVGLFNETKEALAQQTATADVLKVISRSVSDVAPVFETILESCQRLLGLESVAVYLVEGDMVRGAAQRGWKGGDWGRDVTPLAGSSTGRAIAERRAVHVPNLADKPELPEDKRAAVVALGGITVLYAPMLLEDRGVGSIVVSRTPAKPFSDKEIALAQSFADQAAIAIQNARMFDEVQARTREVEEALAQQTATADVLKVISRSAFDLDVVFDALLRSAVSLFGSRGGTICVRDGDGFKYRAVAEGWDSEMWRYLSAHPPTPGRASVAGRILLSGKPEIVADTLLDGDLKVPVHSLAGSRSVAGVPLLRDNKVEGALMVGRAEPGPFDSQKVELLQTFADQAVIAIENARLFEEVQARTRDLEESLAQQTATADVLKVISRSAFDLQAVFDTLLSSAVKLAGAAAGSMCVRDGVVFSYRASSGLSPELIEHLAAHPASPGRGSTADRVLLTGEVVLISDVLQDDEYVLPTMQLGTPMRSTLGVPLLRDDRVEGALVLVRLEPGIFHERQIETVKTFADQAVIAIENVRLFDEVQARTKELAQSLDDLRKAQDRLIQSEKLASLGQLTAGIAHEIKNPLNFVNNFSALSRELVGELADVIKAAPLEEAGREEADELIEIIGGNLDKVVQHGKRADSIVKNMLLHSREGSGERSKTNINPMVEEALNLAYHGMRAEKPGFNVTIVKSFDPNAGSAEVYAQEMTRVLLNLISNGFYATSKRRSASGDGAYEPTIAASTRDLGHSVEIAIRDNGTGIPDEVKAKMFNPFFTTKPAGEGTGLGLSLSHDIVVKQHGGTIEVSTEPGAFTQFTIVLPRAGARA